jgi:peroxiredoxin
MGKEYMGTVRSTFVIENGKLTYVEYGVKTKAHAQKILDLIK